MTRAPFEWLRSVNPVPKDEAGDDDANRLLLSILNDRTPRRARPRRIVIGAAAVVAATLAAAAAWVITRSATDPSQVACFATASLDADRAIVDRGTDPLESCAAIWSELSTGSKELPPFQACVLDSGVIGVFPAPGPQVCESLGLNRANATLSREAKALVAVEDELRAAFGSSCLPQVDGGPVARTALDRAGLHDWHVKVEPPLAGSPCASLAVDTDSHTIVIAPISPPPGGTTDK